MPFCTAFLEIKESGEKLERMKDGLVSSFPFLHASNEEKPNPSSPITTKAEAGLSTHCDCPGTLHLINTMEYDYLPLKNG